MTIAIQDQWFSTALGRYMNPDNMYGYQCKDTADDYCVKIFGRSWRDTIRPGNGKDVFANANPDYFTKIRNDTSKPNLIPVRGDIVNWGWSAAVPEGHVAVVWSATAAGMWVFEQDGYAQTACKKVWRPYLMPNGAMVVGWLRPRKEKMIGGKPTLKPTQRQVGNLANVAQRTQASTNGKLVAWLGAGDVYDFKGYVRGEKVSGNNIWFVGRNSGQYAWSGGFTSTSTKGLPDLTPKVEKPGAGERQTAAVTNCRQDPTTASKETGQLAAGAITKVHQWTRGQKVTQGDVTTDIWFDVDLPGWAWAGAFTSQSTSGLPELKPKPTTRKTVVDAGLNVRSGPTTDARITNVFPAGSEFTPSGYVATGQDINGTDVWFVIDGTRYAHASGVTDQSTAGIKKVAVPEQPEQPGTPEPEPQLPYTFEADLDCVTEVIPARVGHFKKDGLPAKPAKCVWHEFNAGPDRLSVHIGSVISWFTSAANDQYSSAHFVVEGKRVVQMVKLGDRAYHAGPGGNDYVGVETYSGQDPETIASMRRLARELDEKYGYKLAPIHHKDVAATQCGTNIDLSVLDEVDAGNPLPETPPIEPPTDPAEQLELLDRFFAWLKQAFTQKEKIGG